MAVDDSYTISLLHFDGADTSITFTDESGKVWTAGGSAQLDTADKKYGASSGLFAVATSDNISTPDHADWTLGSDDWTVELWMKLSSTDFTVSHLMFTTGSNTNVGSDYAIFFTLATGSGIPTCVCGQASGTAVQAAACDAVPDATTWHHYAAVKYGTVLTVYVDGVGGLTTGSPTGALLDGAVGAYISGTGASNMRPVAGWIDEFRFSKGIARYTANFTPPGPFYPPTGENPYFADGYSVY